jgi:hypothetical protein
MTEEIEAHVLKKYEILQKLGNVLDHISCFGPLLIGSNWWVEFQTSGFIYRPFLCNPHFRQGSVRNRVESN